MLISNWKMMSELAHYRHRRLSSTTPKKKKNVWKKRLDQTLSKWPNTWTRKIRNKPSETCIKITDHQESTWSQSYETFTLCVNLKSKIYLKQSQHTELEFKHLGIRRHIFQKYFGAKKTQLEIYFWAQSQNWKIVFFLFLRKKFNLWIFFEDFQDLWKLKSFILWWTIEKMPPKVFNLLERRRQKWMMYTLTSSRLSIEPQWLSLSIEHSGYVSEKRDKFIKGW